MAADPIYDVFLSHASPDKPQVEELARRLKAEGLKPFLDKWHLVPGEPWQEAIEKAMDRSRTYAVFVGPGHLGPWQNEEMRNALAMRVRDDRRRVIPVLLPGAAMPELPPLLTRLTWVDFRNGLNDPSALHRLLCGVRGVEPEAEPIGSPALPPPARPTMIGVPHRNPFFAGRQELLTRLHHQLKAHGISALAQAAIHGLGGIGKTQAAIEYVHRFWEHYRCVIWVTAEEEAAIRSAYLSIARELRLVEPQADLETAVLAVKTWLSHENGWLLVFDNADNPSVVRPFLPPMRTGGTVLLTSRSKSFVQVGIRDPLRVEILEPDDAVKFLIERTGDADAKAAAELATELGYLPLALEQAAAYIEAVGGGFAEYLVRYRRQGVALLARGKPPTDYSYTIATTWTLSFAAVRTSSPAAAELLIASAFLVPDSIPIEIFTLGSSQLGDLLAKELESADEDPLTFWELVEPLERYSLVDRLPDNAFKLHRLTQEVIKDSLNEKDRRDWAARVIRALNAAYPVPRVETWKICERLQPIARLTSGVTRTYRLESVEAGRLFNLAGHFALVRGDFGGARFFNDLSLQSYACVVGGEHPDALISRNNLAESLRSLGDFAGARKLHEQNLEICNRVLGKEHPDTLASRVSLAEVLRSLGDFAGARALLEQTLEILERVLGCEHPLTLQSRNNLAGIFSALGDLAGARKLYEQNLEIRTRVLGSEHPDTLTSSNNLAAIVEATGDLAGAKRLHEQILEVRERVLGAEHPETLSSRGNLVKTLYALGDLAGVRGFAEKTLEVRERVMGSEHPDTGISRNHLAEILAALGDLASARKLHEQNLEINERVLGAEHPTTLMSRSNLAATDYALGDRAGARKHFEQILEIQERLLGKEHPDTTNSCWNLLHIVHKLNDSDAEAPLIDKLRWLLNHDEHSILSVGQRRIRQYLLDYLNYS